MCDICQKVLYDVFLRLSVKPGIGPRSKEENFLLLMYNMSEFVCGAKQNL